MAFRRSDRLDELNFNSKSKHMLVSIATTYPISEEDLACIDPSNTMSRYDMQVDLMGYDFSILIKKYIAMQIALFMI